MIERIIVLVIVFGAALAYDLRKLPQKPKREVVSYLLMTLLAGYLAVDFLLDVDLPDMDEILDWTVAKPGKWISDRLNVLS